MGKNKQKVHKGRLVTSEYLQGSTAGHTITVFLSNDQSIQVTPDDVHMTTGSERAFQKAQQGKLDCYMKLCSNWNSGRCVNESRCFFAHVDGYDGQAVLPILPAAPTSLLHGMQGGSPFLPMYAQGAMPYHTALPTQMMAAYAPPPPPLLPSHQQPQAYMPPPAYSSSRAAGGPQVCSFNKIHSHPESVHEDNQHVASIVSSISNILDD